MSSFFQHPISLITILVLVVQKGSCRDGLFPFLSPSISEFTVVDLGSTDTGEWYWQLGEGVFPKQPTRTVPATVPGNLHSHLMREGLRPDPMKDDNYLDLKWIVFSRWTLTRTLHQRPHLLLFEGIDTVASVLLNNITVLEADNMHRQYRVNVSHVEPGLEGAYKLTVVFNSSLLEAERRANDSISIPLGRYPPLSLDTCTLT